MSCYFPLIALQELPNGKPYQIQQSTNERRLQYAEVVEYAKNHKYRPQNLRVLELPCGKCVGCRLQKSLEWSQRLMCEFKTSDNAWFVTLTYDDEHLPKTPSGLLTVLTKKQFSAEMKRFRRAFEYHLNVKNVRFFMCAEYGFLFERPHYHVIFFNLPLNDLIFFKKTKVGSSIFISPFLSKLWGKGFVSVGSVTAESCAYVARYTLKKQNNKVDYADRVSEWINMSNRSGIGADYFNQNFDEIYKTDSVPLVFSQGKVLSLKPSRYYDKLFDVLDSDEMSKIKEIRSILAENTLLNKMSRTTLNLDELRSVEHVSKLEKSKCLKRNFENSVD